MDLPSFQGETNSWRNKQHLSGPAVLNNNFLVGCFVCVASLPSNYLCLPLTFLLLPQHHGMKIRPFLALPCRHLSSPSLYSRAEHVSYTEPVSVPKSIMGTCAFRDLFILTPLIEHHLSSLFQVYFSFPLCIVFSAILSSQHPLFTIVKRIKTLGTAQVQWISRRCS